MSITSPDQSVQAQNARQACITYCRTHCALCQRPTESEHGYYAHIGGVGEVWHAVCLDCRAIQIVTLATDIAKLKEIAEREAGTAVTEGK